MNFQTGANTMDSMKEMSEMGLEFIRIKKGTSYKGFGKTVI